jgi:uncharacterized membrane protein YhaH (DUF805 family)
MVPEQIAKLDPTKKAKDFSSFFFTFKGRITRYDFIYGMLLALCLAVVPCSLMRLGELMLDKKCTFFLTILQMFELLIILPFVVRRLQDLNSSGLWSGSFWILSILLFLPSGMGWLNQAVLCLAAVCAVQVLLLALWKGKKGVNRFGEEPLQNIPAIKIIIRDLFRIRGRINRFQYLFSPFVFFIFFLNGVTPI